MRNRDVQDSAESQVRPSPLKIDHPDFRYATSRNPYGSRIRDFQGLVFSDHETEAHQGQWRSLFANSGLGSELHVEIGCNGGHVLLEWAARNPERLYIGIDWKYKPIFRAAEKAVKRGLKNVLFFRAHAERLPYMFGPGEIDHLYLFFPDPWPKKKQLKNRFVTSERLTQISPLVRPEGCFHIRTDHPGYFEWMEQALSEISDRWTVLSRTRDRHAGHPEPLKLEIPDVTLFERLFIRDGIAIQSLRLSPR